MQSIITADQARANAAQAGNGVEQVLAAMSQEIETLSKAGRRASTHNFAKENVSEHELRQMLDEMQRRGFAVDQQANINGDQWTVRLTW
jgi:DNA-binding IclR family transcriptional regulator